jgi:fido (protein-threonine AMPylation protein)
MHLQQLSARAGHPINLTRIDRRRWMAASRAAQKADYQLLAAEIRRAMP